MVSKQQSAIDKMMVRLARLFELVNLEITEALELIEGDVLGDDVLNPHQWEKVDKAMRRLDDASFEIKTAAAGLDNVTSQMGSDLYTNVFLSRGYSNHPDVLAARRLLSGEWPDD